MFWILSTSFSVNNPEAMAASVAFCPTMLKVASSSICFWINFITCSSVKILSDL